MAALNTTETHHILSLLAIIKNGAILNGDVLVKLEHKILISETGNLRQTLIFRYYLAYLADHSILAVDLGGEVDEVVIHEHPEVVETDQLAVFGQQEPFRRQKLVELLFPESKWY